MIYILLPAYNEELALPIVVYKLAQTLRGQDYKIVIVNDGSSDNTLNIAKDLAARYPDLDARYPIHIISHIFNLGLGPAMRDGLKYIVEVSKIQDFVITMDCDDTHEPRYIPEALEEIKPYNVLIMSRYVKGSQQKGLSLFKKWFSFFASLFLKIFFPIKGVKDYSCGYRIYRACILKKAMEFFEHDFICMEKFGFAVTPEILVKLRMLKESSFIEFPFTLRYDQKPTKSSIDVVKTIKGYIALVTTYWGKNG